MINAKVVSIDSYKNAMEEVRKIGVDADAIPWLAPKAIHITIKLYNVSCFAANIIKQEMLGKGGDAAVNRGTVSNSVDCTDVLLMGTISHYRKLIYKLSNQPGILKEIGKIIQEIIEGIENEQNAVFECGKYKLPLGEKTYVMGILNVTPDSFSDGGKYMEPDKALEHAVSMIEEGADIIDVGGESTRPGHQPVSEEEELRRVVPVIKKLAENINVPISIDTWKARVAYEALENGASIVNDIWGLKREPEIANIASKKGAGLILMHNKEKAEYEDLMGEIIFFLRKSLDIAVNAGIRCSNIVIDPGIGFGKTLENNLEVMRKLKELKTLQLPILLGTSRKSMIGNVLELPVEERLEGTLATIALGIAYGVDFVRVHDVKSAVRVVRMTDAMVRE